MNCNFKHFNYKASTVKELVDILDVLLDKKIVSVWNIEEEDNVIFQFLQIKIYDSNLLFHKILLNRNARISPRSVAFVGFGHRNLQLIVRFLYILLLQLILASFWLVLVSRSYFLYVFYEFSCIFSTVLPETFLIISLLYSILFFILSLTKWPDFPTRYSTQVIVYLKCRQTTHLSN